MTLPVTEGLVAAYDFVQGADPATLYDISGNGHHGTITGATWTAEGLLFDGVDDYVNIGNIGSLAEGYTIFAAVKTTSGGLQSVVSRTGPGGSAYATDSTGFDLRRTSPGEWSMIQYDGVGPTYAKYSKERAQINDWQILAGRCDGSSVSVGQNGRHSSLRYAPSSVATIKEDPTKTVYIGRLAHYAGFYLNGTVAYVAIYNRPLSPAETEQISAAISASLSSRGVDLVPRNLIDPMVVIIHDDGTITDYTNAYRIAKARDIPITSFISPGLVGTGQWYMNWDQIREMRAAGHGIECHTNTHLVLTSSTEAEIRANLEAANAGFAAAGLAYPEHISYPGGYAGDAEKAIVSEYRASGRHVTNGVERVGWWDQNVSWYDLHTFTMHAQSDADVTAIKARIDDAIANKYALLLYTHRVTDDPGAGDCRTDLYEEILDYIAAKRDAGLIEPVTIDGLYRAMQGIRSLPATGSMTLHGETTGATFDKTVDYVGFVWGTTRHNNPEGTAPDASEYDQYWISPAGDYAESKFAHTPELLAGTTYYYRAAAKVDGVWVYGEELTLTVAPSSDLPALYPAKLGSPYTILTAPYTTGDALMTVHDADKLETPPNVVCLSGSVAGEFSYTGRYGNTLTGVTALPGTPQATWGVGTFAFRGIAAYDLNSLIETVERLKALIAALQTPGE